MNPDGSISGLTIFPGAGLPGGNKPGVAGQRRSTDLNASGFDQSRPSGGSSDPFASQKQTENPTAGQPTSESSAGQSTSSSSGSSSSRTPVLGGICGVASTSKQKTLKTYNGRDRYNEWEFYYAGQQQLRSPTPAQGVSGAPRPGAGPAGNQPAQPVASQPPVQQTPSPTPSP